jgi:hypothetical protein
VLGTSSDEVQGASWYSSATQGHGCGPVGHRRPVLEVLPLLREFKHRIQLVTNAFEVVRCDGKMAALGDRWKPASANPAPDGLRCPAYALGCFSDGQHEMHRKRGLGPLDQVRTSRALARRTMSWRMTPTCLSMVLTSAMVLGQIGGPSETWTRAARCSMTLGVGEPESSSSTTRAARRLLSRIFGRPVAADVAGEFELVVCRDLEQRQKVHGDGGDFYGVRLAEA